MFSFKNQFYKIANEIIIGGQTRVIESDFSPLFLFGCSNYFCLEHVLPEFN